MWRSAMTKTQKQKDQMNLTPTQLLQKHSREESYPWCLLGFSAPEMHHLDIWEQNCPDIHMG